MANILRLTPAGLVWPYSLGQLRLDEPTRSFSDRPSDAEYAEFGVFRYVSSQPPPIDPTIERVEEVVPALVGDVWMQQWAVVDLTPEEQAAYYRLTHPPRWLEFGAVVQQLPAIKVLMDVGLEQASPLALAIAIGLGKSADGDPRVFLEAWARAVTAGLVPSELITDLQSLAVQYDLPAEFVQGLDP